MAGFWPGSGVRATRGGVRARATADPMRPGRRLHASVYTRAGADRRLRIDESRVVPYITRSPAGVHASSDSGCIALDRARGGRSAATAKARRGRRPGSTMAAQRDCGRGRTAAQVGAPAGGGAFRPDGACAPACAPAPHRVPRGMARERMSERDRQSIQCQRSVGAGGPRTML